jgi:hypothetical protein
MIGTRADERVCRHGRKTVAWANDSRTGELSTKRGPPPFRAGARLGTVSYSLEVWQTIHVLTGLGSDPPEEVEGLKDFRIRIERHDLDLFKLMVEGGTLTLQLDDGRSIDGFFNGHEFVCSSQVREPHKD